jgi:lysophospholipase L1-like esterase
VNFHGDVQPQVAGRGVIEEDGSLKMAWSGTSATVHFHGTAVSVDITDNGQNQYLVLIDGKPKRERVNPSSGRTTVELIRGLPRGEHTVTLYRLNEPLVGTSILHGFVLDESGRPLAPDDPARPRIEILGDSISTGYGNLGESEECGFSPETQDHFLTYGARAARSLDADLTTIAWSGKGVFTNRGSTTDLDPLPALWRFSLPAEKVAYDFSGPAPRAVVINLGSNDFAPEVKDTTPFASKYASFTAEVRETYADAYILLAFGPLLTDDYPEGMQALTTVRKALAEVVSTHHERGDKRISVLEFGRPTPEEGWGCDFHPTVQTHERMAAELVAALQQRAGF